MQKEEGRREGRGEVEVQEECRRERREGEKLNLLTKQYI